MHLYPHNNKALNNLCKTLRNVRKTAIIQPTGTGKAYVALGYIEKRPELRFLYLSPSTRIFEHVKDSVGKDTEILQNVEFISYQKLQKMEDAIIATLKADVIILDEFHRAGATKWQVAIRKLLETNAGAFVIGLSATPIRYLDKVGLRNMTKELFKNSVANHYTLRQAIADKILPQPKYILCNIESESVYRNAETRYQELVQSGISTSKLQALKAVLDEMYRSIQDAEGVKEVLDKQLPNNSKIIVFCRNYRHLDEVRNTMKKWLSDRTCECHEYICKAQDSDCDADIQLAMFSSDHKPCIRILYTVDMLNEGIHIDDLTGIMMLRPTTSPNLYLQQIGRALASGKAGTPVIYDMVDNYHNAKVKVKKIIRTVLDEELGEEKYIDDELEENNESKKFNLVDFSISDKLLKFNEICDRFDEEEENIFEAEDDERWEYMLQCYINEFPEKLNKGDTDAESE